MESRFFYNVDDKSEPFHNEENVSDDISEALMRGVIRDLRASIKNPQDYTARTDPNVPIEEVAGVMAIQNRYSMMARWHEVLFPVLEEFTAEAMDQNQKLLALPQDMGEKRHASAAFFGVDALQKALDRTDQMEPLMFPTTIRPEKVPLPMWIMPMCFTKFPQRRLACPWYFFMATVSPVWVG